MKIIIALLLLICPLFAGQADPPRYILYCCFTGKTAKELDAFWQTCNSDPKLANLATSSFPPHISLTSFFEAEDPEALLLALEKARQEVNGLTSLDLSNAELKQKKHLHFVKFRSPKLYAFASSFVKHAHLDPALLKAKQLKPKFHLTLARDFKKAQKNALINLEDQLNFKAKFKIEIHLFQVLEEENSKIPLSLLTL